ncbi:hypothetical protein H6G80_30080 [Nostoc sp. FACHB-87]|uniref:hypothetical protein n=1 Tax=Nostocales TaxID=1161 RepID=UPI0016852417|nr:MULTISPECIES: hypothetical protein [Nostocales]MBD2303275.1 hypothetical protein [Nostoc sp. FACHB-190]MBD2458303.1 hypothetical protein [Nostoc sp. FACHB-87]MBD2479451.1 hypothetical protein [Anabaena sp. FACHB-83]MBD2491254.1 hypothetical protein [Aulosira sp. FACHB-615]
MLIKNYLFAQSQFAGGDLIQQAAQAAQALAQGFDELWQEVTTGTLYATLCDVGVLFAVATFVFFMVEWTKQMLNGEEQKPYTDFIWVLLIVALLVNDGQLLGQGTIAIRNYINNTNNFVLQKAAAGTNLAGAYQRAAGVVAVRSAIANEIQNCKTSSLTPQESIKCLEDARQRLTNQYPTYFQQAPGARTWAAPFASFIQTLDRIIQAPIQAIQNKANPLQVIFSPFSAYIGSRIIEIVSAILLGLNGAYQWSIELTMLLTAYLGPLAVGGSLLPYGSKAIFAWLTGYFSVGIGKLSFNIMIGLAGQLMATSSADQPLFFLFTIGIMAPFLSAGLAAGGGLALWQQINKAAEIYTSIVIDAGKAFVTKGASLAAKK